MIQIKREEDDEEKTVISFWLQTQEDSKNEKQKATVLKWLIVQIIPIIVIRVN